MSTMTQSFEQLIGIISIIISDPTILQDPAFIDFVFYSVDWVGFSMQLLMSFIPVVFAWYLAKKKERSIFVWVLVSSIASWLAVLVLFFLPSHKLTRKESDESSSENFTAPQTSQESKAPTFTRRTDSAEKIRCPDCLKMHPPHKKKCSCGKELGVRTF